MKIIRGLSVTIRSDLMIKTRTEDQAQRWSRNDRALKGRIIPCLSLSCYSGNDPSITAKGEGRSDGLFTQGERLTPGHLGRGVFRLLLRTHLWIVCKDLTTE